MAEGKLHWGGILTVASVGILVGTELLAIAWATGWALAIFLGFGESFALIVQAIFAVLALFAAYSLVRQALRIEPVRY
jgi:hypothetical protein